MLSSNIVSVVSALMLLGAANAAQPTVLPTRKPTVVPTIAPTVIPTVIPTVEPTQWPTKSSPGWVTENFYDHDDLAIVVGTRTETCLSYMPDVSENEDVGIRFKYICGDNVLKIRKYYANDTNCEYPYDTERIEEMETELDGVQFGFVAFKDFNRYTVKCSDNDDPFTFAPANYVNSTDNSTIYYATEIFYPDLNQTDVCASTSDATRFTSYLHDFCFHYETFDLFFNSKGEYSGKFDTFYSPSENVFFKKYDGDSCYDWTQTPISTKEITIEECTELHVYNTTDSSSSSSSLVEGDARPIPVHHLSKTPLDRQVKKMFDKVMGNVPATASADGKRTLEEFTSTYTYGYADDDTLNPIHTVFYSQWVNTPDFPTPTAVPTMMPTAPTFRPTPAEGEPTAAPTHIEAYKFSGTMQLTGIDQADWYAKDSNSDSFVQAAAAIMLSINPDDVTLETVKNVHTSSRKLRALDSDSEVVVDFTVEFVLASVSSSNISVVYDEMTSAMHEGVYSTGLFDSLLQGYSAENGGSLDDVRSTDVSFSEYSTVDTTQDEHKRSTHSGLIVGIVVGLGVGLACIAGMAYWVFFGSG